MIITEEEINYIKIRFPHLTTSVQASYEAGYAYYKEEKMEKCHFSFFRSLENAAAWSEGKVDAEVGKANKYTITSPGDGAQTT